MSHNRHQQQRKILELTTMFSLERLIFEYASPLASLFFISLPPLVMFELMVSAVLATFSSDQVLFARKTDAVLSHFLCDLQIVFVLVFLVIVPLCNPSGNLWNLIGEPTNSEILQGNNVSLTPTPLLSVFDD